MRVLVTGASGFIGRHLVARLCTQGREVFGLDRRPWPDAPCPAAEVDICDAQALHAVFSKAQPDAVVHLAACVGVRPSLEDPGLYTRTNVAGTRNVLACAEAHQVGRVVFSSSSSVYGATTPEPSRESDPLRPRSPYAQSKIDAEALVRTYGGTTTTLRLFTVYGPSMRHDLAIRRFAQRLQRGESLTLFGDGSSCRDYTHVDDVVAAMLSALQRSSDTALTCNIGTGHTTPLRDMVRLIADTLGVEAQVEHADMHPADALHTCADVRLAGQQLGYAPTIDLAEGIRRVVPTLVS
jgi:UDP-glucuronate 4-epimerase